MSEDGDSSGFQSSNSPANESTGCAYPQCDLQDMPPSHECSDCGVKLHNLCCSRFGRLEELVFLCHEHAPNFKNVLDNDKDEANDLGGVLQHDKANLVFSKSGQQFKVVDNSGGGNCLLHALVESLNATNSNSSSWSHGTLRAALASWLVEHADSPICEFFEILEDDEGKDDGDVDVASTRSQKVDACREFGVQFAEDGVWAGEACLTAAANVLACKVNVFELDPVTAEEKNVTLKTAYTPSQAEVAVTVEVSLLFTRSQVEGKAYDHSGHYLALLPDHSVDMTVRVEQKPAPDQVNSCSEGKSKGSQQSDQEKASSGKRIGSYTFHDVQGLNDGEYLTCKRFQVHKTDKFLAIGDSFTLPRGSRLIASYDVRSRSKSAHVTHADNMAVACIVLPFGQRKDPIVLVGQPGGEELYRVSPSSSARGLAHFRSSATNDVDDSWILFAEASALTMLDALVAETSKAQSAKAASTTSVSLPANPTLMQAPVSSRVRKPPQRLGFTPENFTTPMKRKPSNSPGNKKEAKRVRPSDSATKHKARKTKSKREDVTECGVELTKDAPSSIQKIVRIQISNE